MNNEMMGCRSDWLWANLSYNLGISLEGELKSKTRKPDSRFLCPDLGPSPLEYASGIPTT